MPYETQYLVQWNIEIYAQSPREAALKAREIQLDPDSIATVFEVRMNDQDPDEAERFDLTA